MGCFCNNLRLSCRITLSLGTTQLIQAQGLGERLLGEGLPGEHQGNSLRSFFALRWIEQSNCWICCNSSSNRSMEIPSHAVCACLCSAGGICTKLSITREETTAFHPRPSGVSDEVECRVLLKLPHTNLTPALPTALRHTTAERQNRVVVLLKVNVLAAAQTDGHVSRPAARPASSNSECLDEEFFNYSIFAAGLERKPPFRSRWRAPGTIARGLRGVWMRAICRARPSVRPEWESVLHVDFLPRRFMTAGGMGISRRLTRADASFPDPRLGQCTTIRWSR